MRYHRTVPAYHVENFGCRATQADGAALERQFEERGLTRTPAAQADVVVLNTCTVTAEADRDARAAIRRVQRQNPNAKIVVTGCYAQRAPDEISALSGVTCVVGNSHKHQLAEIALREFFVSQMQRPSEEVAESPREFVPLNALSEYREARKHLYVSDIFAHTELLAAPVFDAANDRTRPNLKVQDGCDNRCSFCVIPYVRGQSRSLPEDRILSEVSILVAAGYRELVMSGINLGRWGRDLTPDLSQNGERPTTNDQRPESTDHRLESLLHSILDHTSLEKLRISSVEPMDWSDELIALVAESPRIAKHAHVPLQSGSDAVLRRMHRKYRPWHYREKIEKIRAAIPTAAIGADVMVGFPGETDAEFEQTRRLIEDLPFTYLHVFTYSARPGTPAATMPDQVPVHIARERNRILRQLAEEKKRLFMQSFIGKTLEAITLGNSSSCSAGTPAREASATNSKDDQSVSTEALTDNFQKLRLQGHHAPNLWLQTKITAVQDGVFQAHTP